MTEKNERKLATTCAGCRRHEAERVSNTRRLEREIEPGLGEQLEQVEAVG
jgi:hypothetical protein